jgi:WD40 repeat protein
MAESRYQGVQHGDHNIQHNYFGPVIRNLFLGSAERLQDVCFDPAPLERDLDLARFTGRDWLIARIDSFISDNSRGYVLIRAESGVGKSTLAAHLVWTRPWLHHFTRLPGGRSAQAARKSLAAQLIARWNLAEQWAPDGIMPPASSRSEWFSRLLDAAARERDQREPGEPVVLVVDGLDEVDDGPEVPGLPVGLPVSLPDGVFVVATSRFGIDRALHGIRRPAVWLEIDVDGRHNMADIRQFIADVTHPDRGDDRLRQAVLSSGTDLEWFRRAVAQSCAGVWIYLQYVLDEIRDGVRDPRSATELPSDLAGYYAEQIERWRGAATRRQWAHVTLPLLGVLGAAQAPLTVEELKLFAGVSSTDAIRAFTEETVRPFLHGHDDGSVELRHQSLRDFIEGDIPEDRPDVAGLAGVLAAQVRRAHRAIADALTPPGAPDERDWDEAGPYARRHLAAHAAAAGTLDVLVCDPGFLLAASPGSVMTHRSSLRTTDGTRALAAFEMSLHDWNPSAKSQTLTRLGANAARLHSEALAAACRRYTDGEWQTRWASWSGQQHRKLVSGSDVVSSVAIALAGDRQVIISGSFDGAVRIWDAVTGDPIGMLAHDAAVMSVAIGQVGSRDLIVTGAENSMVRIWDAITCEPVGVPLAGHRESVAGVAIGRIGDRDVIVTGSVDKTARIWDAITRKPVNAPLAGHDGAVRAVAIGRIGNRDVIVTGSDDKTAQIWDASGLQVVAVLTHSDPVRTVVISKLAGRDVIITNAYDRRKLFMRPMAGTVRIWDAVTGQLNDTSLDYYATVMSVTASRIGGRDVIVTGSFDQTVRMWDASTGLQIGSPLVSHTASVTSVTLGRVKNRDVIVSGSGEEVGDAAVRIWDAPTGDPADASASDHRIPVESVAIGRAGDRDVVFSGARDGAVRIWDAATGDPVDIASETGHAGPVYAVAIGRAAGRDVIVTGSTDEAACIWDAVTGEFISALTGHHSDVRSVAIGKIADRDVIVTGAQYGTVRIWDAASFEPIRELHAGRGAWSVAIGRAGNRDIIACGSLDRNIHIWDAVTGEPTRPPLAWPGNTGARPAEVRCVAIGRGGNRDLIASGTFGTRDNTVRMWDAVTGQPLGAPLTGHTDGIWSVAIGRIGNRDLVISGSRDNTVRIWDAVTGASVGTPLTGHDGWVHSVAIGRAAERDLIVSGSEDTTLIAYEHRPHPELS